MSISSRPRKKSYSKLLKILLSSLLFLCLVRPGFSQERFEIQKIEDYYVIRDNQAGIELLGLDDVQATHYYTLLIRHDRCKRYLEACSSSDTAAQDLLQKQGIEIAEKDILTAELRALNTSLAEAFSESQKNVKRLKTQKFFKTIKNWIQGAVVGAVITLFATDTINL